MTLNSNDRLYDLLPAIYRIKDTEQQQSLRALFAILESEFQALESDIQGLYDNWFIETCDEWVVPYIGDLLKVPVLHTGGIGGFTLRSYVANVLAYRRRKGTASVLEQMAHDVSGWPTRAVEFQKSLATTQNLNHIRSQISATIDLRNANELELLGGPFQTAKYGVEVRSIQGGRGKYNIPNIGLFVWRMQSYVLNRVEAAKVTMPGNAQEKYNNRYTFNPLGIDQPLFNRPQTETKISHLAEEQNVPGPLRRRPLYDELEARRLALSKGDAPKEVYFGSQPVFRVYLDGSTLPLLPQAISICDLSDWHDDLLPIADGIKVQVDPQLGRLAFPGVIPPEQIEVRYAYGFSADIGGGPYNRSESLQGLFTDVDQVWWAGVAESVGEQTGAYTSFADAIQAWNDLSGQESPDTGVIVILDSFTYDGEISIEITVPKGKKLLIVAAQWLSGQIPGDNEWSSELGLNRFLAVTRIRPHIKANISVVGEGAGELYLNGLLIEGMLTVAEGELRELALSHCTIVPQAGGLTVKTSNTEGNNSELGITITHSICGAIIVPDIVKSLSVDDSIIDALSGKEPGESAYAIAGDSTGQAFASPMTIERSTIFGQVYTKELTRATEVIFTRRVKAERLQVGCVRFSYVPPGSEVPRRFRCQPDLALAERLKELRQAFQDEKLNSAGSSLQITVTDGTTTGLVQVFSADDIRLSENERKRIELYMTPVFSSESYGEPDYVQLSMGCPVCPKRIRVGAEDGSEMGAFSHLKQAQREANIRTNLAEYLRYGMEAEIFYVNYKEIAAYPDNE